MPFHKGQRVLLHDANGVDFIEGTVEDWDEYAEEHARGANRVRVRIPSSEPDGFDRVLNVATEECVIRASRTDNDVNERPLRHPTNGRYSH